MLTRLARARRPGAAAAWRPESPFSTSAATGRASRGYSGSSTRSKRPGITRPATGFDAGARALFAAKQNLRVLEVPLGDAANALDFKRVGGGMLLQTPDLKNVARSELRVVTKLAPTAAQMDDLLFAWKVAKFVKSNAIVFCGGGMTLGVGAGQMSRIDSARIARIKAGNAGLSLAGSAVASDAFFPFRDGLDVVIDEGAACVIQPGGSMRDDEVIAAADERAIAMVFTGTRHFRH